MQISLVLIVAAAATCVTGQHLLLAGGGLTKDSDFFWNRLIQLAGGKERARIGIITAGRANPEQAAQQLTDILTSYGAIVSWIGIKEEVEDSANDPVVANLVSKQLAIFIDDGDPHRIIKFLRKADGTDSLVLATMRERQPRVVISGSGAGAAVLSGAPLPISGNSYETLIHGTKAHSETGGRGGRRRGFQGCTYIAEGGLAFLRSWLIEPQFNEESLHGRTIRLLLDTRAGEEAPALGLGIDREMALAIYRVGRDNEFAEVLGNKGGITIMNATGAQYQTTPSLKITGVSINFLSEDDKLILATDEVLPASWKADLSGEEWHVLSPTNHDIFSADQSSGHRHPGNFNKMAKRLFDSVLSKKAVHYSHQTSPQLQVEMDRRSAYAFHNDSPSTSHSCISYTGLRVAISQRPEA